MKDHHSYNKVFIGASDMASLTVRTPDQVAILNFGEDGDYRAYIVDSECEIPEHYKLTFYAYSSKYCSHVWMKIYDDEGLAIAITAPHSIRVYQAGAFGCIIQRL